MKYDAATHKYAVVQNGFSLYGVGETEDEAIENAAEWLETKRKRQGRCTADDVRAELNHGNGPRVHGCFYVITDPREIQEYVEAQ